MFIGTVLGYNLIKLGDYIIYCLNQETVEGGDWSINILAEKIGINQVYHR